MRNRAIGKKVLIIVENLPVPLDRRVWQEAISLEKAGYKVTVLCPRMKGYVKGFEVIDGIRVYRHPIPEEARGVMQYLLEYSAALFWEIIYTFYIFLKERFEIIQVCNPPDLLFLVALPYKLLAKVKFIFDFHDSSPEIWVAKGGSRKGLFSRILRYFERASIRTADVVMTVNEPYKAMVVERSGSFGKKVFVVRNSPRVQDVAAIISPARVNGKTIVGFIGVMGKQDGVEYLLDTLEYIVHEKGRRDIHLKLMGTGPEYANIKEKMEKLGLSGNTILTGWVSGKEYVEHLMSCDICVNADLVNDYNNLCSPNKIYEYMNFSKPIVQFPMAENSHLAEGACLFARPNDYRDMGDRILELADNQELCRILGETGNKRFHALFTWERSEEKLLEAYSEMM
jgi:glycosyltransferase involved in cell wall biosynthesis